MFVALFAAVAPVATLTADKPPTVFTTVALCVPMTSPLNDPVKFVALSAVVALVAVVALPFKLAVITPALKLPEASRLTIVLGVLLFVALFAAVAPVATLAADKPPTVFTTVAD